MKNDYDKTAFSGSVTAPDYTDIAKKRQMSAAHFPEPPKQAFGECENRHVDNMLEMTASRHRRVRALPGSAQSVLEER
ncbi:MAG: hypothetical protein JJ992_01975 [Planctomycetes bacterium]|nr:hypothetical protein [Planctomycetota bacterium]